MEAGRTQPARAPSPDPKGRSVPRIAIVSRSSTGNTRNPNGGAGAARGG